MTYEHIPPQAAFNDGKFVIIPQEVSLNLTPLDTYKGKQHQGGIGKYSLCKKCNNLTGRWYGDSYVQFVKQAANVLINTKFKPTLIYPFLIFPLRIIKQIVTMFLSINHSVQFFKEYPELVKFVLNKNEKYLDPKFKVYAYYNFEGNPRYQPIAFMANRDDKPQFLTLTEFTFPPFGFVLTINCPDFEEKLVEITDFSRFGYNEFKEINIRFNVLPTNTYIPTDYRTKEQILKAINKDNLD
ncbi:MAG: hypothetical protein MUF43_09015 [Flavobacterium sp.]|nr:hypothetical protein [Flavobacterium sp.]